jgi:PAS domain S-box-containing protein
MKLSLPSADDSFSNSCQGDAAPNPQQGGLTSASIIFPSTGDYGVLALCIVLAAFAAYATLELAGRLPRRHRARRIWCLTTGIILVAGALAAAQLARVPFFRFVPYHYSAVLPAILAAVVASWIALQSLKGENPDQASAARFQTLAEAIPQIVWIADSNGRTSFINKRWYEMTGTQESDALGHGWTESVHPDDRAPCKEKWEKCMRSGETFEIEYRLHDATHGYRWYLDQAVPLRDDQGVILQWFGTCTDIEEQKHYQQMLEQQIKERTEELAGTNTRLQQEMWEKDLARRTLDEHNDEMMQALKERSRRATLLAKMGELLQSCQTREEVFTAALGFAPQIFPSCRGAVALLNPSHNLVEVAGQWYDCQLPVTSFEPESCWALRAGHPHLVLAGDSTARCGHAAGVQSPPICVCPFSRRERLSEFSTFRRRIRILNWVRPRCLSRPPSPPR